LRVGVPRRFVELRRRGLFDNSPKIHDRNSITDVLNNTEIVGDEKVRDTKSSLQIINQI
jgi:hypothetical protein